MDQKLLYLLRSLESHTISAAELQHFLCESSVFELTSRRFAAFKKLANATPTLKSTSADCNNNIEYAVVDDDRVEYDFLECENTQNLEPSHDICALSFEEEFGLNTDLFQQAVVVFGEKHPNQNRDSQRVAWSDAEVKIIGRWCEDSLKLHPDWRSTIVARCLNFINSSDDARPYFHPRHVEDSSRLRHGYDLWLAKEKKKNRLAILL